MRGIFQPIRSAYYYTYLYQHSIHPPAPMAPLSFENVDTSFLQRTVGAMQISAFVMVLLFGFATAQVSYLLPLPKFVKY